MIHYHGGPITPTEIAHAVWKRSHAFISFARPEQLGTAAAICQSFALDNGAYSHWQNGGGTIDVTAYVAWVSAWKRHPGFDWCVIPDVIDGSEQDNDVMLARFQQAGGELLSSVPVWHLHESFDRLQRLCHAFARVALGSSGEFSSPSSLEWWKRINDAMSAICIEGRPPCKLHGLRMLNNTIVSQLPLASADSANIARNHARYRKTHSLSPLSAAIAMREYIESHAVATRWSHLAGHEANPELLDGGAE